MNRLRSSRAKPRSVRASLFVLATLALGLQAPALQAAPPAGTEVVPAATPSPAVIASGMASGMATGMATGNEPAAPSTPSFDDSRFDLHLSLVVEGANVCIMVPESRSDPVACNGVDLARVHQARAAEPDKIDKGIGVAMLRFKDWSVTALAVLLPGPGVIWDDKGMQDFAEGFAQSVPASFPGAHLHGTAPGSAFDDVQVGGQRAVRYFIDAQLAGNDPSAGIARQIGYALAVDGGVLLISFMTDAGHEPELHAMAGKIMATLQVRTPSPAGPPKLDARAVGYHSTRVLLTFIPFVAMIAGILALLRSRKKTPRR